MSAPVLYLSTNQILNKQRCIWFYCWTVTLNVGGDNATNAQSVESNVAAPCETGWFIASTGHLAIYPDGVAGAAVTRAKAYVPLCP